MKKTIQKPITLLLLLFSLIPLSLFAQISRGGQPYSVLHPEQLQSGDLPTIKLPALNVAKLLAEDALTAEDKESPYRFGKEIKVNYNLQNAGLWEVLPNGDRLWRLKIYAHQAQSLSLLYNDFYLPKKATFFIYNEKKTSQLGAFTAANNKKSGRFATGLTKGETTILEYYEPAAVAHKGRIQLESIVQGYRGFFTPPEKGFGDSGICNKNVNCPEMEEWQNEQRSVVLIVHGGSRICSGTMINNTRSDCTPYLLTANHCPLSDLTTTMFIFNYESPNCDNIDGPTDQSVVGANLIANNGNTDFLLLELSQPTPIDYNVYYAGWNREDAPSKTTACIHHPRGDIKKISLNTDSTLTSDWAEGPPDLHWQVNNWETGTTEPTSSGAGLFDENRRIVGQLRGGTATCNNLSFDSFGKFSRAWNDGNQPNQRLQDWLAPDGASPLVIDGHNCTQSAFALDAGILRVIAPKKVLCREVQLKPQLVLRNYGNETLTKATIVYQLNNETETSYLWEGELDFFEKTTISLPKITVDIGNHQIDFDIEDINDKTDQNTGNNNIKHQFEIINGSDLVVELTTDSYANETSFEIVNQAGEIVYMENSFFNNITHTYSYCLPAACYQLILRDSWGDGLEVPAQLQASLSDNSFSVVSGEFQSEQAFNFCIETADNNNMAVQAAFTTNQQLICQDESIEFIDQSFNTPNTWQWFFEGGTPASSNRQNPTIVYAEVGTYDVQLIVSNNNSQDTLFLPDYVTISAPPTLTFMVTEPQLNDTDGTIRVMNSNTNASTIENYLWSTGETTATLSNIPEGFYSVTVTDELGCMSSAARLVQAHIDAPDGILMYPNPVRDQMYIYNNNATELPFALFNLYGQQLMYKTLAEGNNLVIDKNSKTLNNLSLSTGVYIGVVYLDGKEVIEKIFIDQIR